MFPVPSTVVHTGSFTHPLTRVAQTCGDAKVGGCVLLGPGTPSNSGKPVYVLLMHHGNVRGNTKRLNRGFQVSMRSRQRCTQVPVNCTVV